MIYSIVPTGFQIKYDGTYNTRCASYLAQLITYVTFTRFTHTHQTRNQHIEQHIDAISS